MLFKIISTYFIEAALNNFTSINYYDLIITGDLKQLDRKDIKKSKTDCGLEHAAKQLQDMDEVGLVEFHDEDIVRNPLISKILEKW